MPLKTGDVVNRLHLTMLLMVMVIVAIFLGYLFGGKQGPFIGASVAAILAGVFLWRIAPREYARQLRIIERSGAKLANPEEFRIRFLAGARMSAVILMVLGTIALAVFINLG